MFGAVSENGTWRPRTNKEIEDQNREPDIVTEIKRNRLRWIRHVERMEASGGVKKIFKGKPEGRRGTGRPRKRYLDDVEDDLEQLGVRGQRRKAREREKNGQKSLRRQKPFKGCERRGVVVVVVDSFHCSGNSSLFQIQLISLLRSERNCIPSCLD
jgi:hypothetical protein